MIHSDENPFIPTVEQTKQAFSYAIFDNYQVEFYYHGSMRIVQPHVLYRSREGNVLAFGYQLYDGEKPDQGCVPRAFSIKEVRCFQRTLDRFECSDNFDRTKYKRVITMVRDRSVDD